MRRSKLFLLRDEKKKKNRNYHPTAEDDAESATDDEEDEPPAGKKKKLWGNQFAQQQQLPVLTSPITEGGRYQLWSTPGRLAASQRGQQQQPRYPFVAAARVWDFIAERNGAVNTTTMTARNNISGNAPLGAHATGTSKKPFGSTIWHNVLIGSTMQ
jgi:hypothetical protein